MHISLYGVKLWNSQGNNFKRCSTIIQFKKIYTAQIYEQDMLDE